MTVIVYNPDIPLVPRKDGKNWKLAADLRFSVDGTQYVVSEGFETNFTSVPRPFYHLIPPWGKYGIASIIHDYYYRTRYVTRKFADSVFLEVMRQNKVFWFQKWVLFLGVRVFGWFFWKD